MLLAPQVSKRVDDDAKDQVENDDDDDEEEQEVVDHSGRKQRLLRGGRRTQGEEQEKQFKVGPFSGWGLQKSSPLTALEGRLRISPTPPPFRRP